MGYYMICSNGGVDGDIGFTLLLAEVVGIEQLV